MGFEKLPDDLGSRNWMVAFPGPAVIAVHNTIKLNLGRSLAMTPGIDVDFVLVDVGAYRAIASIVLSKELSWLLSG